MLGETKNGFAYRFADVTPVKFYSWGSLRTMAGPVPVADNRHRSGSAGHCWAGTNIDNYPISVIT